MTGPASFSQEGVDLETYDGPMVKTLYLYEDYANRATEGGCPGDRKPAVPRGG